MNSYPIKCFYRRVPRGEVAVQLAVVVSKRRFKHAVDRNRLRRLMREAYRLHSEPLKQLESQGSAFHIAIYNMDKQLPDFPQIERAMVKLIAKITQP